LCPKIDDECITDVVGNIADVVNGIRQQKENKRRTKEEANDSPLARYFGMTVQHIMNKLDDNAQLAFMKYIIEGYQTHFQC
jgi:hypothetical protein